jgi:hypothetical protein
VSEGRWEVGEGRVEVGEGRRERGKVGARELWSSDSIYQ